MATKAIITRPDDLDDIAVSPENPQTQSIEEQQGDLGVPPEIIEKIKATIKTYRQQWAPDRLIKMQNWMRNVLMYRGQQMLAFDPATSSYFDAWQWWLREGAAQNKMDGQSTDLEQFINNITKQLGESFIGTMSRATPPILVQPENAEDLSDVTTAKAAQESIGIIERINGLPKLVRQENFNLYNYGAYFKHTRGTASDENGWDEEEILGDVPVPLPDRMHCMYCGADTPMTQFQGQCTDCNTPLNPGAFYPAEVTTGIGVVGIEKRPKAMVRFTVHSPLEIDAMPLANKVTESPSLSCDLEIDVGTLRATFPIYAGEVKEGVSASTTPNAEWERLRRSEVKSLTESFSAEAQAYTATYSRNWLQPTGYWRLGDKQFAQFMEKKFPEGVMLGLIGELAVQLRPANLGKEWTHCPLHENLGLYPPSIADDVVPFNERLNDAMNIIHDWIVRCSAGVTFYDKGAIDSREIQGKEFPPGELHGLQTMSQGLDKKLSDSIYQFEFKLEPRIFEYPAMLIEMAEQISGVMPQTFGGGTQKGVETAKGQAQQLDSSLTKLNIFWENVKEEHAEAAQNAIYWLQRLMRAGAMKELQDTIQANGSEFRTNYVDFQRLQGKVKISSKVDEGLPQSPEQIRQTYEQLYQEASGGNEIAKRIVDVVANQEKIMTVLAPGLVIPGSGQRSKTTQDINTLLQNGYVQTVGPPTLDGQTGQIIHQLPVTPEWYEDFPIARDTMRQFCQENPDIAKKNPAGWLRLKQYNDLLEEMDMEAAMAEAQRKLKVQQAGAPPAPQLSQGEQAALAKINQDAAGAVDNLDMISHLPPAMTGGTVTAQVTASGKILDTAIKANSEATKRVAA